MQQFKTNMSNTKRTHIFSHIISTTKFKSNNPKNETTILTVLAIIVVLFVASVTGFFIMWFTEYYNNRILSNIVLTPNSSSAESWVDPNPIFDTLLKVHVFNYTNIHRYLAGKDKKLKVDDIGPLTYKEHTTKVNISFNKNYTVTFRDHRSYEFLPEKSSCGELENVIVPNVPLLTAVVKVKAMNFFKQLGVTPLISSLNQPAFKKVTAHEYLWGYQDKIMAMKNFGKGSSLFGLLMNRNGTSPDSLQINTGEDDIRKLSKITQFNGAFKLQFWDRETCNSIDGSDGSMFPPHLVHNRSDLEVFLQVLCRKIPLTFEKEVLLHDKISALRYRTPINVFSTPDINPNNKCYCEKTLQCMPSGIINATKCYDNAPIYPSFPHFFSGDPKIYENIDGIKPHESLHQTYADIHPRFAFPIHGASRIQINIAVHKSALIKEKMTRINEGTILPLIWIEITSGDFTNEIIEKLYISTFGIDIMQIILKYASLVLCIILFSLIFSTIYFTNQKNI